MKKISRFVQRALEDLKVMLPILTEEGREQTLVALALGKEGVATMCPGGVSNPDTEPVVSAALTVYDGIYDHDVIESPNKDGSTSLYALPR